MAYNGDDMGKMQPSFPYLQCQWGMGDPDKRRQWYEALERTGPENVRARLAHTNAASVADISIGTENSVTVGFAQEWLAWHDQQKAEREAAFRRDQIYWTRWAALAATLAGLAAAFGWGLTGWRR
jgi:hypothetical protein